MKSKIATLLGAALLCGSFAVNAQPGGDAGKGPGGHRGHHFQPCSSQTDPAKCEAERKKMREDFRAARDTCKDSKDKRACMTGAFCSKQADPAKCQAHAKERKEKHAKHSDERQSIAEACTGKRGEALQACKKEQWQKKNPGAKPGDKKG